ncbi:MAG: xanthine dehydrogenase family protein subunit M [Armatimonadota bacterium]|nr:xanthine dehydrogenase family protein subunit M [Armatimonadota bacterium]MDR7427395.1 xanthine dehydrogenase family protein subunit M [Armatimonadota bacterium]MDR7463848.1 xanthine dehydrogenase family protein subunit M [Armatimonadota bacterium]MDR7470132.1 xanthine dehydrogenase family protein subunit M [Armatimonadota bacterium]MDR7474982.1 xanthine dehydrogenase family protein subunit M [Armatimonadota bacterium]
MKPAPFRYAAPRSVGEALALLQEYGPKAKVLAGGQSLVPLLHMRLARPEVLVDINRIRALAYIRRRDDRLHIGALTRQRAVEASATVRRHVPLLWEAIRSVGHPQIRNRGTVGGSLAHADPAAELPAVVAALDAELVVAGPEGERVLSPEEFFTGYLTTALQPTELLVEIRFPPPGEGTGSAFVEVARRQGDFALVGVAAVLQRRDGAIGQARLAFTGVGPGPVRAREAERLLQGETATPRLFAQAAREASTRLEPPDDIHATAQYRRDLAAVLAHRALEAAWQRSRGRRR